MTDPYRISDQPAPAPAAPARAPGAVLRGLVWLVLVVSLVGNSMASVADLSIVVQVAFGVVAVLCVAVLIARRPRRSR